MSKVPSFQELRERNYDLDDDDYPQLCDACSGSGEGQTDGKICTVCKGRGR